MAAEGHAEDGKVSVREKGQRYFRTIQPGTFVPLLLVVSSSYVGQCRMGSVLSSYEEMAKVTETVRCLFLHIALVCPT